MIKSMTGYGRSEFSNDLFSITVEMRSVNHRFLELFLRSPKELAIFEDEIKKCIQELVKRGRVDCTISLEFRNDKASIQNVNWETVDSYMQIAREIKERYKLMDSIRLESILALPDLFIANPALRLEEYKEDLLNTVRIATESLVMMRENEGQMLKQDAMQRIEFIQNQVESLRSFAPQVVTYYRNRLTQRVQEFLAGNASLDEARIMNEIAIFADKSNIDEELLRLESHCKQYIQFLHHDEPIGRKIDFLLQEMNREINTIGSKANDLYISQIVITIKSEIEKLREQVQNIE